ncbi:uncharacterized protein LOC111631495 isoform X1 [Centruroides sculpturatus]|uniref:uncharacterized protein LOC111631495 isoform X1 n=1 Tax=Centruroides sculpturatus TaxID=218467 RepID=UPI000C6DA5C1|nr:uncharacterized protein LOC111631495 isoform X1 [Centruroides sculpturatus]
MSWNNDRYFYRQNSIPWAQHEVLHAQVVDRATYYLGSMAMNPMCYRAGWMNRYPSYFMSSFLLSLSDYLAYRREFGVVPCDTVRKNFIFFCVSFRAIWSIPNSFQTNGFSRPLFKYPSTLPVMQAMNYKRKQKQIHKRYKTRIFWSRSEMQENQISEEQTMENLEGQGFEGFSSYRTVCGCFGKDNYVTDENNCGSDVVPTCASVDETGEVNRSEK